MIKITDNEYDLGKEMIRLAEKLFPICRSITGNGVRETLKIIQDHIPLTIHEVPSGSSVFDWTIPKEWNITDAYIKNEDGEKIIDFQENNLHVVGYSTPIDKIVDFEELQDHLYSLPDQPDAIPYITSYYKKRWGFCFQDEKRQNLKKGKYQVFIDSELKDGSLTYGELIIPGESDHEIFLSTYICHPSMANNELSGPIVTTYLAKWILSKPRKFTYRIIFIPETIGSIMYLSKHYQEMKRKIIAGFNLTCVGDNNRFSFLPSKQDDTLSNRAALNVLRFKHPDFKLYSFLDRGSDERQYNSPGIDLPIASVMRSKYGEYPEYHTSLDNLDFISSDGLSGSYELYKDILYLCEHNCFYKMTCLCEPQLGKRGLYPLLSTKKTKEKVKDMMNFIAYSDGKHDLIEISNLIKVAPWDLYPIIDKLKQEELIEITNLHNNKKSCVET